MKIEHIALNVEDVDAVVAWYVEALGFRIARKTDNADKVYFVADSAGAALIEFYQNQNKPFLNYGEIDAYSFHIALTTSDLEGDLAQLIAAGAVQEGGINVTVAGDRLVFLRDPWGICLQLAQRATAIL